MALSAIAHKIVKDISSLMPLPPARGAPVHSSPRKEPPSEAASPESRRSKRAKFDGDRRTKCQMQSGLWPCKEWKVEKSGPHRVGVVGTQSKWRILARNRFHCLPTPGRGSSWSIARWFSRLLLAFALAVSGGALASAAEFQFPAHRLAVPVGFEVALVAEPPLGPTASMAGGERVGGTSPQSDAGTRRAMRLCCGQA